MDGIGVKHHPNWLVYEAWMEHLGAEGVDMAGAGEAGGARGGGGGGGLNVEGGGGFVGEEHEEEDVCRQITRSQTKRARRGNSVHEICVIRTYTIR